MSDYNVDRTSHIDIVDNPDVKAFLNNCDYMRAPTGNEIDDVASHFLTIPDTEYDLPQKVISIDGSNYEASVRKELPFTRVGFVKISNLLIKRNALKRLSEGSFVNPFEVAKLSKDNSSLSFTLPSTNMCYKGERNVRDSFRRALDEILYNCRFWEKDASTSLRTTLFRMASLRSGDVGVENDKLVLFKCPSCSAENLELWDIPEVQRCPHCGNIVYPSDCLRIWEDVGDAGSNQSALTRFTNAIMHLLVVHYIRFLKEKSPDSYLNALTDLCFIVNGPLAIFGNPAWLHASILKYLYDINKELIDSGRAPIIVMGILKNGAICDYFKMIGPSVSKNSIYAVSDEFRDKYINFDREPSSTTFGAETYYGQDFLLKTETGKLFVFNALLPFKDKHNKAIFKKEKANLLNYKNIGTYIELIKEFECDLDSTSIVPIALAQRYTAISLEPGGQVLDLLAKSNFE